MSKVDGRKIPHDVRESIRMDAIQLWLDGATVNQLAEQYATRKSCIYDWIEHYEKGGFDALKTQPIKGHPPKLTQQQRDLNANIITLKSPTDFGFYKAMWTRDIVASVIKSEFDITMHPAAVGKVLRRMRL